MVQQTTRTATVKAEVGLHARPASTLAQAVTDSGLQVSISKNGGTPVNAASILSLMALGAKCGESVEIIVEGNNSEVVADSLVSIIETEE